MVTIVKFISILISLIVSINLPAQRTAISKPKIEIFLIKKLTKSDSSQPKNNYFLPAREDLSDTAFIKDNEITGYEVYEDTTHQRLRKSYSLLLSKSGQQKINTLKNIPLCCGKKFAVVLNGKPVFGAYIWNIVSSFGCNWLTTYDINNGKLTLLKGLPDNYFDETKQDPRGDTNLINAFKVTKRLITAR